MASRIPRAVIHIGLPKTGTSTLQRHSFPEHSQIEFLGKWSRRSRAYRNADVDALVDHACGSCRRSTWWGDVDDDAAVCNNIAGPCRRTGTVDNGGVAYHQIVHLQSSPLCSCSGCYHGNYPRWLRTDAGAGPFRVRLQAAGGASGCFLGAPDAAACWIASSVESASLTSVISSRNATTFVS